MNRVIVFHDLVSNDPLLTELCKKVKTNFNEKNYRLNFFKIDHPDSEVEKSCKSQSVNDPIHFLFDPSCSRGQISKRQGRLAGTLTKFKLKFIAVETHPAGYIAAKVIVDDHIAKRKLIDQKMASQKNTQTKPQSGRYYQGRRAA